MEAEMIDFWAKTLGVAVVIIFISWEIWSKRKHAKKQGIPEQA